MDVGAFRSNNDRKEQTERPIHMVPAVFPYYWHIFSEFPASWAGKPASWRWTSAA